MNKTVKLVLCIVAAVAAAAAAVYAVVRYWDKISEFISKVGDKCAFKKPFTSEEYEDFADI